MTNSRQDRIQSFAYVISVLVSVCLFIFFIPNPMGFSLEASGSEIAMENRINPNNASVESLVRLAGIGPVRAAAIVEYREKFKSGYPTKLAFENLDDLQKVKGIGPQTAKNIAQWLKFE